MTAKLFLCSDQDGGYWWPAAGIQLPAIGVGECFKVVIVRKD